MSKLTINFFGVSISVPKPKDLQSLRRIFSLKFFLTEKDAKEIIVNYIQKGEQISITSEEVTRHLLQIKNQKDRFRHWRK